MTNIKLRPVVYIACPYSHPDKSIVEKRVRQFSLFAASIENGGQEHAVSAVFNHLVNMYGDLPTDWEYWKSYSLTLLDKSTKMYVLKLDGWDKSVGVAGEIEYAIQANKPIIYVDRIVC